MGLFNYQAEPFPSPMSPNKDTEEFGIKVAKAVLGSTAQYIEKRNEKIAQWRAFAKGEQPVQPYLNALSTDGKTLWQNITYKPRAIVRVFEDLVVNGYMEVQEYPKVTAMAKHIAERKEWRKQEALYRMENQEMIAQLSQEMGIPVEDPNAFVPEDKEELDIWWDLNDQEKEELLMQRMLTFTATDVDLDTLKQRALSEQFQTGLHGFYDYIDNNGRLRTEFIQAEDCIYDTSYQEQISRDGTFHGRFLRMSIADIRARWALSPEKEKELWSLACKYRGNYGNPNKGFDWREDYRMREERPYDGYTVEILHVWWKCNKVIGFVEGKDRYGRKVFDITEGNVPNPTSPNKNGGYVAPLTAYEGYFICGEKPLCLQWGEARNILRKGFDKEQVESPFTFYMRGNTGDLQPLSSVDMIMDSVMVMDLAVLKIKSIIAQAAPPGFAVDISALNDLDLGLGADGTTPLEVADIFRNTGMYYYKSITEDGELKNQNPIAPHNTDVTNHIQAQLNVYNAELSNIRQMLGINEFRDGSKTDSRISFRFAAQLTQQSNMATHGIWRAWFKSGENLIRHWGIRIWDSLRYGDPNKGYLNLLGKQDAEFVKNRKELTDSSYDIKFELAMTQGDKEALETNLNAAITAGTLLPQDAVKIREYDDFKIANRILYYLCEKRRKQRMEEAQQNSQMSAQANAEAGRIVEEVKQQTYQIQIEGERAKEQQRKDSDIALQLVRSGLDILAESFKTGKPLSPELQSIVDAAMEVSGVKASKEIDTTQRELSQRQQEDMMQQMAQMQEQEGPEMIM